MRQLSSSTVTRTKGNEAYRNILENFASADRLGIDLRNHEWISFSFLDQVIVRLKDSEALGKVTFILTSGSAHEWLAQIARLRDATIYYQRDEHDVRKPIRSERGAANQV